MSFSLDLALLDEPLALPLDHLGGRALDELRAAELALEEGDLLARPLDLLREALPLRLEVHHALEAHEHLAARRPSPARSAAGASPSGSTVIAGAGQRCRSARGCPASVGRHRRRRGLDRHRQLHRRRDPALAPDGPDRAHEVDAPGPSAARRPGRAPCGVGLGEGRDHDARPVAPLCAAAAARSPPVMNGMNGCSRRSVVSSVSTSVRWVTRLRRRVSPAGRGSAWRSRDTSRSTRARGTGRPRRPRR